MRCCPHLQDGCVGAKALRTRCHIDFGQRFSIELNSVQQASRTERGNERIQVSTRANRDDAIQLPNQVEHGDLLRLTLKYLLFSSKEEPKQLTVDGQGRGIRQTPGSKHESLEGEQRSALLHLSALSTFPIAKLLTTYLATAHVQPGSSGTLPKENICQNIRQSMGRINRITGRGQKFFYEINDLERTRMDRTSAKKSANPTVIGT